MRTGTLTDTYTLTHTHTSQSSVHMEHALLEHTCVRSSPVDVVVLVHAVEFQLEAAEQVLDHDAQVVVEDPGAQAGQVLSLGLQLHQQAVQRRVHLLCLQGAPPHHSQPQENSNIQSSTPTHTLDHLHR